MPKEQQQKAFHILSYARKRGWTVFATTQGPTRVHTGYRQLLTELYKCTPISQGYWHRLQSMDPDNPSVVEFGWAGMYSPSRSRYNTRAEVRPLWVPEPSEAGPAHRAVLAALQDAASRTDLPGRMRWTEPTA
jgi:hypothetical protein